LAAALQPLAAVLSLLLLLLGLPVRDVDNLLAVLHVYVPRIHLTTPSLSRRLAFSAKRSACRLCTAESSV